MALNFFGYAIIIFFFFVEKFQLKCKQTDFDLDVQLLLEASKSDDLEVVKVGLEAKL